MLVKKKKKKSNLIKIRYINYLQRVRVIVKVKKKRVFNENKIQSFNPGKSNT